MQIQNFVLATRVGQNTVKVMQKQPNASQNQAGRIYFMVGMFTLGLNSILLFPPVGKPT